jgi:hypothetical protein
MKRTARVLCLIMIALLVLAAMAYVLALSGPDNCKPAPPRAAADGSLIWDCASH